MALLMHAPLAFIDLETTGLSPTRSRISEIAVITVDGDRVEEWDTLLRPHRHMTDGELDAEIMHAPRFEEMAAGLAQRLQGRLFIAHNARFDYGFLKAAFLRLGMEFQPQVLCSLMLARRLYPQFAHHDLDSLSERHGLRVEIRHRALPDARLLWQFWQVMCGEHEPGHFSMLVEDLLAGPVLPEGLDATMLDRLPDAPGVFTLHGEGGELHTAHAQNLRTHLINYFRVDRASRKALDIAHRVRDITWKVTAGTLGARLLLAARARPGASRPQQAWTWRYEAGRHPCVRLAVLGAVLNDGASFGMFASERKARNALLRLAARERLCHALLGAAAAACPTCPAETARMGCAGKLGSLRQATRILVALSSWRVQAWPYTGPIGLRERGQLHIVDNGRYLGTARNDTEVHEVLQTRTTDFDSAAYMLLARALSRLPRKRIVLLPTPRVD